MSRLSERLKKLEGPESGAWFPGPEGVVLYDGPHDGVAILKALGLDHFDQVTLVVSSEVNGARAVPGAPPKLVTELTEGGRYGMCPEFQKWATVEGQRYARGEAWTICWMKADARKGFVMDGKFGGEVRDLVPKGEGQ